METGHIHVETENILPIIKKFLYSDHEIFLRELVSNTIDATQKLKILSSKGDVKGELGELKVNISIDSDKGTLTISDRGIGMTADEIKKYINQIAFSSAEEFLKKYQKHVKGSEVIGHFGLGFYSAFMVADKIEILTKSYKRSPATIWSSHGSVEYTMDKADKSERGTDVILYINKESKEFLESARIKTVLKKYCKFLPIPIFFEDEQINNTDPAWKKKPASLKDEKYQDFYKELYPYSEPPLFWIHLNVDYPFNLTGILYFPKFTNSFEVQKNKIQLYSNQVFVTDSTEEIVPEFLTMLHGVIDSPDIPLNVSRSFLQSDQNVRKINSYITKKVADRLAQLFKKDRKAFEEKWEHIGIFVKYGMMTDDKFYEKASKFCLYQDIDGKYFTMDELRKATAKQQTDKDDKLVLLYTNNIKEQDTYIQAAKSRKYKVLKFDLVIDNHFLNTIEQKLENTFFKRIDSDILDKLIEKDTDTTAVMTESDQEKVKKLFTEQISGENLVVELKPMDPAEQPVLITKNEFMRRMQDMQATSGVTMGEMPEHYNVIVNANHPVINRLLASPSKTEQVQQLYSLALLSQNMLKGEALSDFVQKSVEMMSSSPKVKKSTSGKKAATKKKASKKK